MTLLARKVLKISPFRFLGDTRGLLHKTVTGEKTQVKSENSGTKHNFTIDFTI